MIGLDVSQIFIAVAIGGYVLLIALIKWVALRQQAVVTDIADDKIPKIWLHIAEMHKESQSMIQKFMVENQSMSQKINDLHLMVANNYAKKDDVEKTAGLPAHELKVVNSTFSRNVECLERIERDVSHIRSSIQGVQAHRNA